MKTERKSESDQKVLKKENLQKIFPASFISLMFFFIAFIVWIVQDGPNMKIFFSLILIAVFIGIISFLFITKKIKQDLTEHEIELIEAKVDDKSHIIDYEAGSGTLHNPILGILFKSFRQEMKQIEYYQIKVNDEQIRIPKEIYDQVEIGKPVYLRQSINANVFFGIKLSIGNNT